MLAAWGVGASGSSTRSAALLRVWHDRSTQAAPQRFQHRSKLCQGSDLRSACPALRTRMMLLRYESSSRSMNSCKQHHTD